MNEQALLWKKIQDGIIVPERTVNMDLSIKMTTCTGTVWIDDVNVRVGRAARREPRASAAP
jgi:hypothetical protein